MLCCLFQTSKFYAMKDSISLHMHVQERKIQKLCIKAASPPIEVENFYQSITCCEALYLALRRINKLGKLVDQNQTVLTSRKRVIGFKQVQGKQLCCQRIMCIAYLYVLQVLYIAQCMFTARPTTSPTNIFKSNQFSPHTRVLQ